MVKINSSTVVPAPRKKEENDIILLTDDDDDDLPAENVAVSSPKKFSDCEILGSVGLNDNSNSSNNNNDDNYDNIENNTHPLPKPVKPSSKNQKESSPIPIRSATKNFKDMLMQQKVLQLTLTQSQKNTVSLQGEDHRITMGYDKSFIYPGNSLIQGQSST